MFPRCGERPVSEIATADVLEILAPIWHEKPETARRVLQRVSTVMQWAVAMEFRTDNPCDRIRATLGRQRDVVQHMRALSHRDVSSALETVRASRATTAAKLAFEFLLLTAARSSEVRMAQWTEVDRHAQVWTIPVARMKAHREHEVPLSHGALDVLDAARALRDDSGLLFPSPRGKPLSDMTLSKLIKEQGIKAVPHGFRSVHGCFWHQHAGCQGIKAVPHGFRSSFRDWAAEETDHPREVVEAALAHQVKDKVEAAYARSTLCERRRLLMNDWSSYLGLPREQKTPAARVQPANT